MAEKNMWIWWNFWVNKTEVAFKRQKKTPKTQILTGTKHANKRKKRNLRLPACYLKAKGAAGFSHRKRFKGIAKRFVCPPPWVKDIPRDWAQEGSALLLAPYTESVPRPDSAAAPRPWSAAAHSGAAAGVHWPAAGAAARAGPPPPCCEHHWAGGGVTGK